MTKSFWKINNSYNLLYTCQMIVTISVPLGYKWVSIWDIILDYLSISLFMNGTISQRLLM